MQVFNLKSFEKSLFLRFGNLPCSKGTYFKRNMFFTAKVWKSGENKVNLYE